MIVTTGFDIQGKQVVEYLGVVRGIVVRATGLGRGIVGGLKSLAGGNIEEWSVVCEAAVESLRSGRPAAIHLPRHANV